jgi:hypothetical protein
MIGQKGAGLMLTDRDRPNGLAEKPATFLLQMKAVARYLAFKCASD